MAEYLLAHDLGTSANKAVLYGLDGRLHGSIVSAYPTVYPQDRWVEQRADDWWKAVCQSTYLLLEQTGVDTPMLADILYDWGDEPHYTDKDFQDMGYKFVSQPFTGCFLALQRLADYFEYYRKNGEVEKFLDSVFPYEEYEKLLGIEDELNIMDTIS